MKKYFFLEKKYFFWFFHLSLYFISKLPNFHRPTHSGDRIWASGNKLRPSCAQKRVFFPKNQPKPTPRIVRIASRLWAHTLNFPEKFEIGEPTSGADFSEMTRKSKKFFRIWLLYLYEISLSVVGARNCILRFGQVRTSPFWGLAPRLQYPSKKFVILYNFFFDLFLII